VTTLVWKDDDLACAIAGALEPKRLERSQTARPRSDVGAARDGAGISEQCPAVRGLGWPACRAWSEGE